MTTLDIIKMYYPGAKKIKKYSGDDIISIIELGVKIPDYLINIIKPKMCYKNSQKLMRFLIGRRFDVLYAEGFVTYNKSFPIEHGFLLIKVNERYCVIDPTLEFGKSGFVHMREDYYVIRTYTFSEVSDMYCKFMDYGPWIPYDLKLTSV